MIKSHRFIVVAITFVLISAAFLIALGIVQAKGPRVDTSELDLDVRTETVYGSRGRIFDRNGVLLVDNTKKYDLIFEYGSMGYTADEMNSALLSCLRALESTNNEKKRVEEDYFPLSGSYPDLSLAAYSGEKQEKAQVYLNKFLVANKLSADISADDLTSAMTKKYGLSSKKYSDGQIDTLLRLRYDMDRIGFGAYQAYTLAKDFETTVQNEMALISLINEQRIEGAAMLRQTGRLYTYPDYAQHILGTVGKITAENIDSYPDYSPNAYVGISGCELAFEEYLRGIDGKLVKKYDKKGNLVEEYYDPAPVVGNDVYLTLDIKLQIAAEDALGAEIERLTHSEGGAATAMIPTTGEVLVVASYPKFQESSFNRALQGLYAPGSTYKVGAALAALEEGHITDSTTYFCNHTYPHLGGPTCLGTHGTTTVSDAIEVSCNIFFYYVGQEMGLSKITPYTTSLGLGVATGIELGERVGTVATHEYCENNEKEWLEFDNVSGAIGQSYHTYTPLQLSVYMSSLVNHGTRYSAHLLKYVKTRTGDIVYEKPAAVLGTLEFSDSSYYTLMSAMESVIEGSDMLSAHFASVPVDVGGKTGTAETGKYDNALFSGYAPAEGPKIVASCVIEHGEAGNNAAKIVAEIFEKYFEE